MTAARETHAAPRPLLARHDRIKKSRSWQITTVYCQTLCAGCTYMREHVEICVDQYSLLVAVQGVVAQGTEEV